MAPGKRGAPSGKAASDPKKPKSEVAKKLALCASMDGMEVGSANVAYNAAMQDIITNVLGHPVFESLTTDMPLGIGHGGFKEPYNSAKRKTAMEKEGMYEASCNLAWCNMFWSPDSGMPRSMSRVRRLADALFPAGRPPVMPHTLVVYLDGKDKDPLSM
eukprot:6478887-Pyramimonas_sp.AAC.1